MANNSSRYDNKGNGGIQFLIFALQIFYKMHLLSTRLRPCPGIARDTTPGIPRRPAENGGRKSRRPETAKLATGSRQHRAQVGK